jgi:hypothetical protein
MTRVSQGTVIQLNISSTTIVYKSYITFSGGHFAIFFWGGGGGQTENFSKEALNIAVLIFGITFRLKLSKLNQFIYLKVV